MNRKLVAQRDPAVAAIIAQMVTDGARLYPVCCYNGRFLDTHEILVTDRGQIFFPDHGMATIGSMRAEFLISKERHALLDQDKCFYVMEYLINKFELNISFTRPTQAQNRMWPHITVKWLEGVYDKRRRRRLNDTAPRSPVDKQTPFTHSARERIQPIINKITAELNGKLSRVNTNLRIKYKTNSW